MLNFTVKKNIAMKNLMILVLVFLLSGCVTSTYVKINEINFIPNDVKALHLKTNLNNLKNVFSKNNIYFEATQYGIKTNDFLIDRNTIARYEIFEKEDYLLVYCYWGITEHVVSQIAAVNGTASAMAYNNGGLERVIYRDYETRPKMVMDYFVTIIQPERIQFFWE